jgi:adenylate cyclase
MPIWRDGMLTREEPRGIGVLTSESYLRSPTRVVDETGRPFRRCPAQEGTGGFPLLEELLAEGGTDYAMLLLPPRHEPDGKASDLRLTPPPNRSIPAYPT